MHKYLLAMTAGAAIMASAPALAQSSVSTSNAMGINNRISQLETRLQAGIRSGEIDRNEAVSIRQQLRQLTRLDRRYSRNGYTQEERRDIQQRIRDTRQQLRSADGGNSRYAEWRDDEYYDRYAQGGTGRRYHEVSQVCAQQRTGLSSILGAVFGSDNCLRVGERATTYGMSAVPSEYRNQFPDTSSYMHRYLEGNVVQIDSRTGLVTRIYDMG